MSIVTAIPFDLPSINFGTLSESIHSYRSRALNESMHSCTRDSKFDTDEVNVRRRSSKLSKNDSFLGAISQHSVSRYCKFLACIGSDSDDDDDDDETDEDFSEQCGEFLAWIDTQDSPMEAASIQDCSTILTRTNGLKSWQGNSLEQSPPKSRRNLLSFYEPSSRSILAVQELRTSTRKQFEE